LYHRFANHLFNEVLDYLIAHRDVFIVSLPRTQAQQMVAKSLGIPHQLLVPPHPLDGPNLLYWSDVVISAGGTMNREAAVLGTPAYTIFGGRLGNVDKHLVAIGQMYHVQDTEDLVKIELRKKETFRTSFGKPGLVSHIVDRVIDAVS
jgi:predicted glycosyltransferase